MKILITGVPSKGSWTANLSIWMATQNQSQKLADSPTSLCPQPLSVTSKCSEIRVCSHDFMSNYMKWLELWLLHGERLCVTGPAILLKPSAGSCDIFLISVNFLHVYTSQGWRCEAWLTCPSARGEPHPACVVIRSPQKTRSRRAWERKHWQTLCVHVSISFSLILGIRNHYPQNSKEHPWPFQSKHSSSLLDFSSSPVGSKLVPCLNITICRWQPVPGEVCVGVPLWGLGAFSLKGLVTSMGPAQLSERKMPPQLWTAKTGRNAMCKPSSQTLPGYRLWAD